MRSSSTKVNCECYTIASRLAILGQFSDAAKNLDCQLSLLPSPLIRPEPNNSADLLFGY
jgi:hypothetical protein